MWRPWRQVLQETTGIDRTGKWKKWTLQDGDFLFWAHLAGQRSKIFNLPPPPLSMIRFLYHYTNLTFVCVCVCVRAERSPEAI